MLSDKADHPLLVRSMIRLHPAHLIVMGVLGATLFITTLSANAQPVARTRPERTEAPWTTAPLIRPDGPPAGRKVQFSPQNFSPATLQLYAPAAHGAAHLIERQGNAPWLIQAESDFAGNHHLLIADEHRDNTLIRASTWWFSPTSGPSPAAMLSRPKGGLEIVPSPLPNRGGGYKEGERWHFLLRYDGLPLGNQPLTLETQAGTKMQLASDAAGIVTVPFPHDVDPARFGEGRRANAPFVLSAYYHTNGLNYLTAFNSHYAPSPLRQRSLALGAGFTLLGMLLALPLLRRRIKKNGK